MRLAKRARLDDAIRAAITIRKRLATFNREREAQGQTPVQIGLGLHTGPLMPGTIGEAKRMESTVISDTVNTASRLEGLTKRYGATLVTSGDTLSRLENPSRYHYRILDWVKVKGRKRALAVCEIFDGDSPEQRELKRQTLAELEQGLSLYYGQQFDEAETYFNRVLERNPQDQAAVIYRERIAHFVAHGVPNDWEGVEVLTEK